MFSARLIVPVLRSVRVRLRADARETRDGTIVGDRHPQRRIVGRPSAPAATARLDRATVRAVNSGMDGRHEGRPQEAAVANAAGCADLLLAVPAVLAGAIYLAASTRATDLEQWVTFPIGTLVILAVSVVLWRQDRRIPWGMAAMLPVFLPATVLAPTWRWILLACEAALIGVWVIHGLCSRHLQQRSTAQG